MLIIFGWVLFVDWRWPYNTTSLVLYYSFRGEEAERDAKRSHAAMRAHTKIHANILQARVQKNAKRMSLGRSKEDKRGSRWTRPH
jgi:hypothetical protein